MPGERTETRELMTTGPQGETQVQRQRTAVKEQLISSENPSVVRDLVSNEAVMFRLSRVLEGWTPHIDKQGKMAWMAPENPEKMPINEKGRAWVLEQFNLVSDKLITMSNYAPDDVERFSFVAAQEFSLNLAKNLRAWAITGQDAVVVSKEYHIAIKSAMRKAMGDKERTHAYGSTSENSNTQPVKRGGLLGGLGSILSGK